MDRLTLDALIDTLTSWREVLPGDTPVVHALDDEGNAGEPLADAEALADMADEIRGQRNPASCDCEHRNAWGYPMPVLAACADDLYSDWELIDREGLAAIQHDTREALSGYHDDATVDWITEEALWQLRCHLVRDGYLRIPRLCDLILSPDGRLTAHPVPDLVPVGCGCGRDEVAPCKP